MHVGKLSIQLWSVDVIVLQATGYPRESCFSVPTVLISIDRMNAFGVGLRIGYRLVAARLVIP